MSVRGALPFLDLAAFLAVAGFHRRSLVLRLTNAAGQGNLVLHEGRVVDALLGPARGVGALFPLSQGADSGSFELFPPPASPPEITITLPLGDILRRLAARSPAAALPANGWSIEGTTEYLSPLEIFQIFEINRRAAALRFWREDTALGEAIVVAGGLLQAAPPQGGAEALAAIFAGRPTRFAVSLLPQPPETAKRQALAPLLCEAIRRCAEVDSSSAAAAASDESEAILARLAKGEIEDFCRYFLAKRYLPGGRIAAPEIVARLCVDPLLEVRNLALATLETLPEGVVEAIAADPATPLPLLRYLLGVAGNPSWAAAAAANARLPREALIACAPTADLAVLAAIRSRPDGAAKEPALAAALAQNPKWEQVSREPIFTPPAGEATPSAVAEDMPPPPGSTSTTDLKLEKPPLDPQEERVKTKLGPKEIQYLCKRGTLRDKLRLVCSNNAEAALEIVRQPGVPETFILSVAESPAAHPMALRFIASNKQFTRNSAILRAVVFNPKTPPPAVLSLLPLLRPDEWEKIAANRDLPEPTRHAARHLAEKRAQKKKGG